MTADSKVDVKSEPKDGQKTTPSKDGGSNVNSMPKDGQVMLAILKDMGVNDFEPKVVNQLLEFSYRYVTNVLEDAKAVSNHARKKTLDLDDVKLAVQMYAEQNVTTPPSREILLDMARTKNANPLPIPKATCGLRLPPDRHCLTAANYRLKFNKRPGAGQPQRVMPGFIVKNTSSPYAKPVTAFKLNPQPSTSGGATVGATPNPVYKISVDPNTLQSVTQPIKRKADQM